MPGIIYWYNLTVKLFLLQRYLLMGTYLVF